jgi:hypothetical protein
MNERIIELRKKAWDLVQIDLQTNERDEPVDNREHLKMVFDEFAKLIVRECADQFKLVYTDEQYQRRIDKTILKHFGFYE